MFLSKLSSSWHKTTYFVLSGGLSISLSDLLLKMKTHSYHSEQNAWERHQTAWRVIKISFQSLWTLGRAHLSLKGRGSILCFNNIVLKEAMSLLSNDLEFTLILLPHFILFRAFDCSILFYSYLMPYYLFIIFLL